MPHHPFQQRISFGISLIILSLQVSHVLECIYKSSLHNWSETSPETHPPFMLDTAFLQRISPKHHRHFSKKRPILRLILHLQNLQSFSGLETSQLTRYKTFLLWQPSYITSPDTFFDSLSPTPPNVKALKRWTQGFFFFFFWGEPSLPWLQTLCKGLRECQ